MPVLTNSKLTNSKLQLKVTCSVTKRRNVQMSLPPNTEP